jgi:hypothetical protein
MTGIYKKHIDDFLNNFTEKIQYIYGGITQDILEERKQDHINDRQPSICDNSWVISQKAITTINIKYMSKLEQYKNSITEVENYLIIELDKKYGNKCKNNRTNAGIIAQRGGAGVRIADLQQDDKIKFYIFYKTNIPIHYV